MPQPALFAIDIVAVILLVFGLYFPRHRRRDLVAAYLGVNVGVMAVASSLGTSGGGAGLGLGLALFGVLSIIRLRSTELDQHEVAYYFCALALGILSALGGGAAWHIPAMMALILLVMFVGDHPRLLRTYRRHSMLLDQAITDHLTLVAHLEQLLGARVHAAAVQRVDLVNDTTLVDVRYSVPTGATATPRVTAPATGGVRR
ncbi:DUF4956 domain-containing protein [Micromonospora sp. HM5-17]|jgi:hypothetical protein|uniref:DUF4956 domain-containing protein n=1 Tax=Micromonospora sp. HM5-17 TaxID=2487710 RepID=UPI000F468EA7|nr:DUF4956 domain-containing protein [Micromonospora sp. HM5-17]ROT32772.1 DUF4956 domain-containing protein [Micromonospora sp. HM5-17]